MRKKEVVMKRKNDNSGIIEQRKENIMIDKTSEVGGDNSRFKKVKVGFKRSLFDEFNEEAEMSRRPQRVPVNICYDPIEPFDNEGNFLDSLSSGSDESEGENEEEERLRRMKEVDLAQQCSKTSMLQDDKEPFYVGQTFKDAKDVRKAMNKYAVLNGWNIKIKKSEPKRMVYKCIDGCPFYFKATSGGNKSELKVKTYNGKHVCWHEFNNKRISTHFVAEYFKEKIQQTPSYRVKEMKIDLERVLDCFIIESMCKRAKKMIVDEIFGNYKDEFNWLQAYCDELRDSNLGSCIELDICGAAYKEGRNVFRRIFVCLNACREGWSKGCRPIIGLDGCFLKSKTKGQLLAAIGLDTQDKWYPIAWVVVDKENKANWEWFLKLLKQELNLNDSSGYTAISDMQKGLVPALANVLPHMEHR